jgi:hypothetical protein
MHHAEPHRGGGARDQSYGDGVCEDEPVTRPFGP